MARVSMVEHGEIDFEERTNLVNDNSENTLESEALKLEFLSRNDYSRAPSGLFKEKPNVDSAETILTMQMQVKMG